jgi:branched-chain amino acid transport system permease protein
MGLTLTFSTLQLFNFAHGTLMMFGAYLVWLFYQVGSINLPSAIVLGVAGCFMIGLAMERTFLKRLMTKGLIEIIIGTLAVALLLENVVLLSFGGRLKRLPVPVEGATKLGVTTISHNDLLILMTSLCILIAMVFFLKRTKFGMAMRAVAQDREASQVLGIDIGKVNMYVLGISGALAGLAGAFLGSIYIMTPAMGNEAVTKGFVICVLGGLGSVRGTIIASFIVAFVELVAALLIGIYWSPLVLFGFMMLVLIIRPSGLVGAEGS